MSQYVIVWKQGIGVCHRKAEPTSQQGGYGSIAIARFGQLRQIIDELLSP